MKFITSFSERRVLKAFWQNHEVFTLETLCKKKIFRSKLLGRITLWNMERKSQIKRKCPGIEGYVGTTEHREEWNELKFLPKLNRFSGGMLPLNQYEIEEQLDILKDAYKALF